MKFVLNFDIAPEGLSFDYPNRAAAVEEEKGSPLVGYIFRFPFVQRVFITANFVTVTKDEDTMWEEVLVDFKKFLKIYFEEGHPVFAQKKIDKNTVTVDSRDSEVMQKIKATLEQYVRRAVEYDGGAINFASFDEISGQVKVYLQGACSGCLSSTVTLKQGIERLLISMLPEVKEVVAKGV